MLRQRYRWSFFLRIQQCKIIIDQITNNAINRPQRRYWLIIIISFTIYCEPDKTTLFKRA